MNELLTPLNTGSASTGFTSTSIAAAALKGASPEKIDEAAQDFEAVFLQQMLEHVFPEKLDPYFGSDESDDVYRGWMIEHYSKHISRAGGIGIASYVKEELLKLQDIAQGKGNEKLKAALATREPRYFNMNAEPAPMMSIER